MGFENWYEDITMIDCTIRGAYEAGAASRQSEIDELKAVITKQQIQMLQIQQSCSGCDYRDLLIDELQNRIDDALVKIQDDCREYGISDSLELAIGILKGDNHEV